MITESQLKVADLSVDLVSRKVSRAGNRIVLTSKEFSLLEFFIRHQGEVLPRSLIASQVWDMNFDSDTNAIDVAVKRLRAKIDNDYGTKLIQTVRAWATCWRSRMHSKPSRRPFSLALRLTFYQPVHNTGVYRLHGLCCILLKSILPSRMSAICNKSAPH